jgi:hypothetical protein
MIPSSAPPYVSEFPTDSTRPSQAAFADVDELKLLWEAANGQGELDDGRPFALKITRNGEVDPATGMFHPTPNESFQFGPSRGTPFYDFETLKDANSDYRFSEMVLRRHDPSKRSAITIMQLTLESSERRLPPNDGLVTLIYPKAAAMMAVDETAMLVRNGIVAAPDAQILTEEAVRKAGERECAKLFWENEKERYVLKHPGLNGGRGQTFALHIEGGMVGFDMPGARGTVRLVNTENSHTLAALEFGSSTLIINTEAIIPLPSFYMVDVAVTALFVVGVVEGRRNRILHAHSLPSNSAASPATGIGGNLYRASNLSSPTIGSPNSGNSNNRFSLPSALNNPNSFGFAANRTISSSHMPVIPQSPVDSPVSPPLSPPFSAIGTSLPAATPAPNRSLPEIPKFATSAQAITGHPRGVGTGRATPAPGGSLSSAAAVSATAAGQQGARAAPSVPAYALSANQNTPIRLANIPTPKPAIGSTVSSHSLVSVPEKDMDLGGKKEGFFSRIMAKIGGSCGK